MSYLVLARKWRPQTFEQVVGQPTVTRTLKNALATGRIGHAFLFSGARGVGKTTTARILARALNCSRAETPTPEPCGECASCREIAAGTSMDVQEIDGATHNGVEQVRELRESARYSPARDRFKVWIIDEVHMLSTGAFNALLKTLEEPPPRVKFIFATTEYHKIPDTILSRCQQHEFRLIPARELLAHLREVASGETVTVSDEALGRIARAAEGSARDALSLFDQVLSFSGREVKDEDISALLGIIDRELLLGATRAVAAADSLALLELVERLSEYGVDYRNYARELLLHLREVLLVKMAPAGSSLLAHLVPEERQALQAVSGSFSEEDILRMMDALLDTETELRQAQDPRVTLELVLLKMVQMRRLLPFNDLVARVERLGGGATAAPSPAAMPQAAPAVSQPRAVPPSTMATMPANGAAAPSGPETPPPASSLLTAMAAQARASVGQALRGAQAHEENGSLVLEVSADWFGFAQTHHQEYQELARKVTGRPLKVTVVLAPQAAPPPVSEEEQEKQKRLQEATAERGVQEALDLFGGRVVDVREARSNG